MNVKDIIVENTYGVEGDSMNDMAIEYLDTIFDKIDEEAQYSQEGDILRYIVTQLQR